MNSWTNSDSEFGVDEFRLGRKDLALMRKLTKAGTDHGKFMRMITVTCDITAPLYWWKEADTYKVGTVANSCSTMHTITHKEFTLDDFSCEHLTPESIEALRVIIKVLNFYRDSYIACKTGGKKPTDIPDTDTLKDIWWQIIQLLPSSYNQRRTVQLNYQVLKNMYHARKNHKLDEWKHFCKFIEQLPYSELITEEEKNVKSVPRMDIYTRKHRG